jgi:yecA family protein
LIADLNALDGFLTCVLVSPKAISPFDWIDVLLDGERPPVEKGELDRQLLRIHRCIHQTAAQFIQDPPAYQPLFETHPGLGRQLPPIDAWCQGLMTATMLCDKQWETLLIQGGTAALLHPIRERASAATETPSLKRPVRRRQRQDAALGAAPFKAAALGMLAAKRRSYLG